MTIEKDLVFVTTTLNTKWLAHQARLLEDAFPGVRRIVVDGGSDWPNSWFYWIEEVKKTDAKYYVHVDEDFFLESADELKKCLDILENGEADLVGPPDGYHHYRGANPVAINTFLMIGRVEHLRKVDLRGIRFGWSQNGWMNSFGLSYKESYSKDFHYPHRQQGGSNFGFEQEPYYAFLWAMKEVGCRFAYLYPHFDERFKSTNPRIDEGSADIGIHMWYTRQWNSQEDVHGMTNQQRYAEVERYLESKINQ